MNTIVLTAYELNCLLQNKVKSVCAKDNKGNEIEIKCVF